jgi:hypothetical protein
MENPPPQAIIDAVNQLMLDRMEAPAFVVDVNDRWTLGGAQGNPLALTWSFIPDGTSIPANGQIPTEVTSPSELFAQMDSKFGGVANRATWIAQFQACFDRWGALTGVSYTRVTNNGNPWDDGAPFPGSGSSSVAGSTRGHVRIGMHPLDGANNVLAYNRFPSNGDMVLDSAENWGNQGGNNYRFLRNTIMHEHGHGLGIQHVCPINQTKLMEPFLSTQFDGPQQDDVRAAHFFYGDAYENNDNVSTANVLGALSIGATINPSTVPTPSVSNGRITSIDLNGDQDWYKVTVAAPQFVTVTVTPIGSSYAEYAQDAACNNGTVTINSASIARLAVDVVDAAGVATYTTNSAAAVGGTATIPGALFSPAGTISIRVRELDSPTEPQLYNLSIASFAAGSQPTLTASDGTFNDRVRLNFSNVQQATGLRILRNTTADRASASIFSSPAPGTTTIDDATAVPGQTYFYWFEATEGAIGGSRPVAGPDSGFAAVPVPGNDLCLLATLAPVGSYAGTLAGAGSDGASSCGGAGEPDVWYVHNATCSGLVRFEVTSAGFDALLSVHTSCPANGANEIACNNDFGGSPNPRIDVVAVAGQQFRVRVARNGGTAGPFTLAVSNPAANNDECAGAGSAVALLGATAFNSCAATTSAPADNCSGVGVTTDLWFRFTSGAAGVYSVDTCGSGFDTTLAVYGSTCPASPGLALACADDSPCSGNPGNQSALTFSATANTDYLVRVGGKSGTRGSGLLNIGGPAPTACPSDYNQSGSVDGDDLADYIADFFDSTGTQPGFGGAVAIPGGFAGTGTLAFTGFGTPCPAAPNVSQPNPWAAPADAYRTGGYKVNVGINNGPCAEPNGDDLADFIGLFFGGGC